MARSLVLEQLPREQSRHQLVVHRLRDAIAQGHLAVGEHLPSERELGEQLGVSRTIVREAMRVLASQGIVTVRQGRRAVVAADLGTASLRPIRQLIAETARETFGDVMDARLILEVASAERAARRATPEDIAAMAEALERLRSVQPPSTEADTAHAVFHRAVARASHNLFLERMVESLLDAQSAGQAWETPHGAEAVDMALLPLGYEAHARIFRPIRDQRAAAARRAMHDHLSTTFHRHPRAGR